MSHEATLELKRLRARERGAFDAHPADCSVALIYPNSYYVGMSNLGFHLVYRLLNSLPGVRCERGFFMGNRETRTLESLSALRSFDCVAFSLSYEPDYFNVVAILRRAGIALMARDRDERSPLIIGGGVCAWLNPEPLADIFDLFVVGEAEAVLGDLFDRLRGAGGNDRETLLRSVAEVPGVYVPRLFEPHYRGGALQGVEAVDAGVSVPERQWVTDLDRWPARGAMVTPGTDFGERMIVEIMRGCGRQCRFCVADYAYRAPRLRSRAAIMTAVEEALSMAKGVALLGPSPTDHPDLEEIVEEVVKMGGEIALSSMRADCVSGKLLETAARGGLKTLTIAPESPSAQLRRRLNRSITSADVVCAAERAHAAGLKELKLYYMIGVSGERESDLEAIAEQVSTVAALLPVRVSVGPLIPKARTPLQWEAMESEGALRKKWGMVRKMVAKIPRARMSVVSSREAVVEGVISRGDRRLTRHIIEGRLPREARERYAERERSDNELFPWEHIDIGVRRDYLWEEREKFLGGGTSPACQPEQCRACGVCDQEQ